MILKTIGITGTVPDQITALEKMLGEHFKVHSFPAVHEQAIKACDVVIVCYHALSSERFETISRLKRIFPALPVLMIGDCVPQHEILEAFRLGANDFIFLPVQTDTLFTCLHRLLPPKEGDKAVSWWKKWLKTFFSKFSAPEPAFVHSGFAAANLIATQPCPVPVESVPALQIQLLGKLGVMVRGRELPRLPGKKAKNLLAYLLHKYPKPVHREVLLEKFWADSTPDSARNCLNVTLHAIRKSFGEIAPGEEIIVFQNESYCLHPALAVERDVDLFESYWKKGRQIEYEMGMEAATDTYHQAFAFYRGDFLEDLPFEEWAERERDKYRETWLVILDRLSLHFFEKGRYHICMNLCRRILEKDSCLEDAHRRLMECYSQLGMKDMAMRQFLKCKENLKEELDVLPGKATAELYQKIREW